MHKLHLYATFQEDANPPAPQELDTHISWWFNPCNGGEEKWISSFEERFYERSQKLWGYSDKYINVMRNKSKRIPIGFANKWKIVLKNVYSYQRINKVEFEVQ